MREDIQGGLKNAMERGASLEQAIKSFINAGYSEAEVRDAAKIFTTPVLGVLNQPGQKPSTAMQIQQGQQNQQNKQVKPSPTSQPAQQSSPQSSQSKQNLEQQALQPKDQIPSIQKFQVHSALTYGERGSNKLVIILIAVLVVLLGVFIVSLVFKDKIIEIIKSALGQ